MASNLAVKFTGGNKTIMLTQLVDQLIETGVLVLGGGIAGPRAAIEAKKNNALVFMIVKGIYGSGGCSLGPSVASGIGAWSDAKDSIDQHFRDMLINGKRFLADQRLLKIQADEGGERLLELEKWGMRWDRDTQGNISLFPSSKLYPNASAVDRWITYGRRGTHGAGPFWTGHGTVDVLREEVNRQGIPYIDETIVSRIFVTDNRVIGALAYDYFNCKTVLIKCAAVVIATGDASQVFFPHTMVSGESTGDGFTLAYDAGAQLVNMEQYEYIAPHHAYPDSAMAKAALEGVSESGGTAYFRNSRGERFMEKYCPKTMELSSTDEIAKAMWQEVKEGRGGPHGGVFLDLRHIPHDRLQKAVPGRLEFIDKLGYRTEKEMVEVFPVIHTTTGGIKIDPECQTRVQGLFAAGQVTFAIGDNLGEGATGYTDALVWGKRAGEFAAKYSQATKTQQPDLDEVKEELQLVKAPLEATSGLPPIKIMRRLQRAMWTGASIVKDEQSLQTALREIEEIRGSMLDKMCTSIKSGMFNHEMREAIELRHMLTVSEMIIRSSLVRKESRNRFHRSDYPNQDDEHWLRHIIAEKTPSGMRFSTIPVEFPYVKPMVRA